jgi:predicted metalloenzyme YecM
MKQRKRGAMNVWDEVQIVVPSLNDVDSWKNLFCLDDEDFWTEGVEDKMSTLLEMD